MSRHIAHLLRAVCAASGLPLDMLPVILPAALARRALRRAESMPSGQSTVDSSWLSMLQAWWERTPENRLERWRVV
ncbi:MAG: hypothetical protein IVW55_18315 [Chloroflexi bacterium]|nr:hypothetical protein [Chloroflexota bacterium]